MEKLARWSRGSFPDPSVTTLNLSDSKPSTMETEQSHVIKSEPITGPDSLTRVSFVSVTPTNQTSLEAVLERSDNDVTHVSTFSLNTLGEEGGEEEGWSPRDRIRSVSHQNRECSLKLSLAHTLSHGELMGWWLSV